jgi:Caulimovirus viroplasmin
MGWLKDNWCGIILSARDWGSFINSNSRSIIIDKNKFYAVAIGTKPGIYLTWRRDEPSRWWAGGDVVSVWWGLPCALGCCLISAEWRMAANSSSKEALWMKG